MSARLLRLGYQVTSQKNSFVRSSWFRVMSCIKRFQPVIDANARLIATESLHAFIKNDSKKKGSYRGTNPSA